MTPELIAEDGGPRQHRQRLQELLDTTNGLVRVASAYVTEDDLLLGADARPVQLLTSITRMDIVTGATRLPCLRALVESGVKCSCLSRGPRLHAKVYIFGEQSAIVTSANLTTNAMDSNIEVGVHITGKTVREICTWFDGFWKKAKSLTLPTIDKWDKETAALRRAYADLRKKARTKAPLRHEAKPSVRSPDEFRRLVDGQPCFFVCNTNRRYSPNGDDEHLMRHNRYAIVWTKFKHPTHIKRVKPGDAILMFAKGIGIIGVGRAKGALEVLLPGDPNRISTDDRHDEEWRVPVDDWLVWAEDDDDAFPWQMPNTSFLDVSGQEYARLRDGVRKRFLPVS